MNIEQQEIKFKNSVQGKAHLTFLKNELEKITRIRPFPINQFTSWKFLEAYDKAFFIDVNSGNYEAMLRQFEEDFYFLYYHKKYDEAWDKIILAQKISGSTIQDIIENQVSDIVENSIALNIVPDFDFDSLFTSLKNILLVVGLCIAGLILIKR